MGLFNSFAVIRHLFGLSRLLILVHVCMMRHIYSFWLVHLWRLNHLRIIVSTPTWTWCLQEQSMLARSANRLSKKLTGKHRLFYVCIDSIATSVGLTEPIGWITLALLDKSWPTDIIFCKESKHCASWLQGPWKWGPSMSANQRIEITDR